MTLDAAIKHAQDASAKLCGTACGKEHKQLADWLIELKQHKRFVDWLHKHLESEFRDYGCDFQMHNRLADIVKDFKDGKKRDF